MVGIDSNTLLIALMIAASVVQSNVIFDKYLAAQVNVTIRLL